VQSRQLVGKRWPDRRANPPDRGEGMDSSGRPWRPARGGGGTAGPMAASASETRPKRLLVKAAIYRAAISAAQRGCRACPGWHHVMCEPCRGYRSRPALALLA